MCGIIAIVRRPSTRVPPAPSEVSALVTPWADRLRGVADGELLGVLRAAADDLQTANQQLLGVPGVVCLLHSRELPGSLLATTRAITDAIAQIEQRLETSSTLAPTELEQVNAALVRVKDANWAIERDRLRTAAAVEQAFSDNEGQVAAGAASELSFNIDFSEREYRSRLQGASAPAGN